MICEKLQMLICYFYDHLLSKFLHVCVSQSFGASTLAAGSAKDLHRKCDQLDKNTCFQESNKSNHFNMVDYFNNNNNNNSNSNIRNKYI